MELPDEHEMPAEVRSSGASLFTEQ